MQFTAAEVLTVVAALGVLVTGVGAVIVNIIVALKTGHKVDESVKKTDGLVAQVKEVHTLTNSNLSAVKSELSVSNALNGELRALIVDLKGERGKLAVLAAVTAAASAPAAAAGGGPYSTALGRRTTDAPTEPGAAVPFPIDLTIVPVLEKIEAHTAEPALNTAAAPSVAKGSVE